MFSPKLYVIRKIFLKHIIDNNFKLQICNEEEKQYYIKQQDSLLLRQIRIITKNNDEFNKYIVFIDCSIGKSHKKELSEIIQNGFIINNQKFVISERSASMTRNSILSFVDINIEKQLNKVITMDINLEKTVLSKFYAYRGLMLSSCHCIENWYPKIIIVPDCNITIKNQTIKYAYDKNIKFKDKTGQEREWIQKDIAETQKDVVINAFDGCGVHHPYISKKLKQILKSKTNLTTILWRAPYIKGVTHEIDYETFFNENNIKEITDIWGIKHDFSEPMIIMTESMYKGLKYFKVKDNYTDWENYWSSFKKYNHCIGISKWNYSVEEEPIYTRVNYQILQDLKLDYKEFSQLAQYSINWIQKIIDGDILYTYCFLGLFENSKNIELNNYIKAIVKNSEMLKEYSIRNYFIFLVKKYIDEMKCGKLWLKASFKFLVPDLIILLEHIGGLKLKGCLKKDEFYSFNINGEYKGNYLIERNPHICKSEHVVLKAVTNNLLNKYCSHLSNTCIINCKNIIAQRLNGGDFDGDLVMVIDDKLMMKGVENNLSVVIDIEDKITACEEEITKENLILMILRTMNNLIGETSNCATAYHNKTPQSEEQRKKYESYIDLLSIINGKAIDFAKTGVLYTIPKNIAKYGKPVPYFMKYSGDYYFKMKTFSNSKSNMNRLCWEIEKWEKSFRFKHTYKDFDYTIMLDKNVKISEKILKEIEVIFLEFCKEMSNITKDYSMIKNYDKYKDELKSYISKEEASNFEINWQYYYDKYKNICNKICPNGKMFANIAVILCYEKYPNKNKKFIWRIAGEEIVENITRVNFNFPILDKNGNCEYLGKKYFFKYEN